ncbi:MAG: tetratricopeptide repeat protein, partial [Muribaculaceae bacterium]|nr:tetratricopeptide repeat protein [Muribaculaceae bacterium]
TNYNYAMSLLNQAQPSDKGAENTPLTAALERLNGLIDANNDLVAELAAYNLGNVEFGNENYSGAIEYYKRSLMRNPDNDQARENLRLAQIKLKDQQNQDQDQDQDQNQDNDQNQDQNKDQQDQQDQNKDQDQQDKQQNQNQQNQDQNQNQQQPQQQPEQQQPQGISAANAQKILDTVEKAEAATRAKVDAEKKKEEHQIYGRPKGNQW